MQTIGRDISIVYRRVGGDVSKLLIGLNKTSCMGKDIRQDGGKFPRVGDGDCVHLSNTANNTTSDGGRVNFPTE